jgi:Tfp pilus assembly protein PilF
MTAIEILGRYLKLLIFPHPLSCDYSFNTIPIVDSVANGGFLLALALHGTALFLAIKGWKEKKVYSYAIFFYLITISIVSNVFMLIGTNMAERLVFLPSLGFCLLISYLIVWLTKSMNFTPQKLNQIFTEKSFNWLIILPVIILFSAKTVSRNKDWENVKTLFDKDVKTVPESVHMLYYHANMMTNSDTLKVKTPEQLKVIYSTAEKELLHALKIHEPFPEVHSTLAKVYQNTNRYPEAIKHYKRRLEMNNTDPTVYNNFGTCYGFIGNTDSAEINFKKAIELSSNCYADALVNMATVYINRGATSLQQNDKVSAVKNYNIAIDYSNQTLKCDWDRPLAYKYMGMAYQGLGDLEKSKKYFQQAEQLEKNSLPK